MSCRKQPNTHTVRNRTIHDIICRPTRKLPLTIWNDGAKATH